MSQPLPDLCIQCPIALHRHSPMFWMSAFVLLTRIKAPVFCLGPALIPAQHTPWETEAKAPSRRESAWRSFLRHIITATAKLSCTSDLPVVAHSEDCYTSGLTDGTCISDHGRSESVRTDTDSRPRRYMYVPMTSSVVQAQ